MTPNDGPPLTGTLDRSGEPEPVSCKSMYRLADKVCNLSCGRFRDALTSYQIGIPELEKLALKHLKTQFRPENICEELLSEFTSRYVDLYCREKSLMTVSRYPKVKVMEMTYLTRNWSAVNEKGGIKKHLSELCNGKITHALPIFEEIFDRIKTVRSD